MRILEEDRQRVVLSHKPWAPWIVRITALKEVVETDADNTSFHRIDLVLDHHGRELGTRAGSRVALTTAPASVDQSGASRRLARWLDVPRLG